MTVESRQGNFSSSNTDGQNGVANGAAMRLVYGIARLRHGTI
jgi:hypothetical protein